jgi:CRP-like cAMP-binding protein
VIGAATYITTRSHVMNQIFHDRQALLASVPLFAHLTEDSLHRIAALLVERQFPAGTEIVHEGERGIAFFVLVSGAVEVVRGSGQHAAGCFGEMALLDDAPRSVTIRALAPSTCLALSRWHFLAELKSDPRMAVELLQLLSRRLRAAEQRLEEREATPLS